MPRGNSAQSNDAKTLLPVSSEHLDWEVCKSQVTEDAEGLPGLKPTTLPYPSGLQIQESKKTQSTYDLHVLTTIPGLSYRYYSIRSTEGTQEETNQLGASLARTSNFGRKKKTPAGPRDRHLIHVENDCYTVFLDLDTNLLHSIWER